MAHDGGVVAQGAYFIELVRDVENAFAFACQLTQHAEQCLRLLRRQHRGRFIEDDQRGFLQQHTQDFHALAHTDIKVADRGVRSTDRP